MSSCRWILTQKGKYFKTIGILKSGWKNYFVFEGFEESFKKYLFIKTKAIRASDTAIIILAFKSKIFILFNY